MRTCITCGKTKKLNEFNATNPNKCIQCKKEYGINRKHSPAGLIAVIYGNQRNSSRNRKHPYPNYTVKEFKIWALALPNYIELHTAWVASNYARDKVPSFDRINDDLPYSFDNLQLVTWKFNREKQRIHIMQGIAKTSRITPVNQFTLEGDFIAQYPSVAIAARTTGIMGTQISRAMYDGYHRGNAPRQALGYRWAYVKAPTIIQRSKLIND